MCRSNYVFFLNDKATTEIYTLSLHDARPIVCQEVAAGRRQTGSKPVARTSPRWRQRLRRPRGAHPRPPRSEEHTSELQSRQYLVFRLLLVNNLPSLMFILPLYDSYALSHSLT